MSIVFSASNAGIVEQSRSLARVDSTQWPTQKIVNSANNWLDFLTGYMIGADKRFQWDDTNHTKLPIGRMDLTINQTDYSFLTDEQSNSIITLVALKLLDSSGFYQPLKEVDQFNDMDATTPFGVSSGTPTQYDKIADNIVRLNYKAPATVASGLEFHFQRTGSYFTSSDTTKSPGVSPLLHRGFVIACAYDIALSLGLSNLQALSVEREREEQKAIRYFADRNRDGVSRISPMQENNR